IGRADAVILILLFCIFLYSTAVDFVQLQRKDAILADVGDYPLVSSERASRLRWLMIIGGCALLYLGGSLTVDGAVELASGLGVSATIIGLFVVAVGTSLPELVTSIIAAVRKESDLALGNVVGSNLFNSLFVLPVGALLRPIPVPQGGIFDLAVSWLLVVLLIPIFIFGNARLGRGAGAILLLMYVSYALLRMT
ncbi:MAG: sodium:calcium antiporter, partial [Gammaproteobacteria bacterium]|nr:sodium:calcium antiporter [Gammaproteobacteria bacterium]